jgi:hypothetical protein
MPLWERADTAAYPHTSDTHTDATDTHTLDTLTDATDTQTLTLGTHTDVTDTHTLDTHTSATDTHTHTEPAFSVCVVPEGGDVPLPEVARYKINGAMCECVWECVCIRCAIPTHTYTYSRMYICVCVCVCVQGGVGRRQRVMWLFLDWAGLESLAAHTCQSRCARVCLCVHNICVCENTNICMNIHVCVCVCAGDSAQWHHEHAQGTSATI